MNIHATIGCYLRHVHVKNSYYSIPLVPNSDSVEGILVYHRVVASRCQVVCFQNINDRGSRITAFLFLTSQDLLVHQGGEKKTKSHTIDLLRRVLKLSDIKTQWSRLNSRSIPHFDISLPVSTSWWWEKNKIPYHRLVCHQKSMTATQQSLYFSFDISSPVGTRWWRERTKTHYKNRSENPRQHSQPKG